MPKPCVVIDTNIWISGLVFGGAPKKVLELFVDGSLIAVTSEELVSELRHTINKKFPLFVPQLLRLEASIRERAIIVQLGAYPVAVSRDIDDNVVIETAIAGNAPYTISGDKDLLVLQSHAGVAIVTPADFLSVQ